MSLKRWYLSRDCTVRDAGRGCYRGSEISSNWWVHPRWNEMQDIPSFIFYLVYYRNEYKAFPTFLCKHIRLFIIASINQCYRCVEHALLCDKNIQTSSESTNRCLKNLHLQWAFQHIYTKEWCRFLWILKWRSRSTAICNSLMYVCIKTYVLDGVGMIADINMKVTARCH